MTAITPDLSPDLTSLAQDALDAYDFGDDFIVTDISDWETSEPNRVSCVIYHKTDGPDETGCIFNVVFNDNGQVTQAYALEGATRNLFGHPDAGQRYFLQRFIVEVLSEGEPIPKDIPLPWLAHEIHDGGSLGTVDAGEPVEVSPPAARLASLKMGSDGTFFDLPHIPKASTLPDVPMPDDMVRRFLAHHFPWLADDDDQDVSGADVVDRLAALYRQVSSGSDSSGLAHD